MTLSPSQPSNIVRRFLLATLVSATVLLFGCGSRIVPEPSGAVWQVRGNVLGGQQPVSGATIQLYSAGTSGYGTGATPLLTSAVSTDASGGFAITGLYTCASPTDQVYLVATGGNPGAGVNSSLALMAALGDCGALTASTLVAINEVTTVASAYVLAPYMISGSTQVGTIGSDVPGLASAFAKVHTLIDTSTGIAIAGPGSIAVHEDTINSLADSLAACINTDGSTGACFSLFASATQQAGTPPPDTISAIYNIVANPANHVADIYNVGGPTGPFQPILSAPPTDWTLLP